jgi:hypothetical protein
MPKRFPIFILLAAFVGLPALVRAQPVPPKAPAYFAGGKQAEKRTAASLPPGRAARLISPREFSFDRLQEPDPGAAQEHPRRIGLHRDAPSGMLEAGEWDRLEDGTAVWRMMIRSPGSRALRVRFDHFRVGTGKVWLYAGDNSEEPVGPYSGGGIYDDGEFWSAMVFGEAVVVEYIPEEGRTREAPLPFTIKSISHQLRDPRESGAALKAREPSRLESCQLDANCYPEWQSSMRMVAHMVFEEDDGQYVCTGTLVSTRNDSFKPYFLTAGHCIGDQKTARSLETYWFYQTKSCNAMPPARPTLLSEVGATLLASGSLTEGDYSLLMLRGIPSGLWFAGWDPNDPGIGAPLTGIHHPEGSWKRISFGKRVPGPSTPISIDGYYAVPDLYYHVQFDQGRVEPGSSGSPLFTGPGVLVGTLTYAPVAEQGSACDMADFVAGYGRFSTTYAAIRDYLEDVTSAPIRPSSTHLRFSVVNGAAPEPLRLMVASDSPRPVQFTALTGANWIHLSGVSAETSSNAPASLDVTVDARQFPRAGSYSGTITLQSGGAAPQTVMVTASVSLDQSRVTLSVSPDPVYEGSPDADGFRWFYSIQLEETAGVETQLTLFRIDGVDLSSEIATWFGSDRIPAGGRLSSGVRARYQYVPVEQFIEVGGRDVASDRRWSRNYSLKLLPPPSE